MFQILNFGKLSKSERSLDFESPDEAARQTLQRLADADGATLTAAGAHFRPLKRSFRIPPSSSLDVRMHILLELTCWLDATRVGNNSRFKKKKHKKAILTGLNAKNSDQFFSNTRVGDCVFSCRTVHRSTPTAGDGVFANSS